MRLNRSVLVGAASLTLAGGAGIMGAVALSATSQQNPSTTVTLSVENGSPGPAGPPGPPGPAGPPGSVECPDGSTFGKLVINTPGGHVTIYTCLSE